MVVERIDGRIATAIKTRDPRRLLVGDRTWSIMKPGEQVILNCHGSPLLAVGVFQSARLDDEKPDTLHYAEEQLPIAGPKRLNRYRTVRDDAINKPYEPWAGKIRQRTLHPQPIV